MKLKHLFCLLLVLVAGTGFSEEQVMTDSLTKIIARSPEDSNKVNLIYNLGKQYDLYTSKEHIENFIKALALAKKIGYNNGYRKISKTLISDLYEREMYEVAANYCKDYIDFCEVNGPIEEKYNYLNILGNLLLHQEKYTEALKYYNMKRQYDLDREDFKSYASGMYNVGVLHLQNKQFDSALVYTRWSAEIFKKNNMSLEMAGSQLAIAKIYLQKGDLENAEEKAGEAYALYTANNQQAGICNSLFVLGQIYSGANKPDSAFKTFSSALAYADSLNSPVMKRDCYKGLYDMYSNIKNYKESFEYQVLYKRYQDEISADLLAGKMLEMEVKYDIAKEELAIKDQDIQNAQSQRKFIFFLIILIIVLSGLLVKARTAKRRN